MNEIIFDESECEGLLDLIWEDIKDILSTDSCSVCEKCAYPKKQCIHEEIMHPCIESHGIIVTNILEKYHMDYFMGENMVLWFSIIFMESI